MVQLSRGELFIIRDALLENAEEDVSAALSIVEEALYNREEELDFNDEGFPI